MRRATPINAFSPIADRTKSDIDNYNRALKSPLETRTPKKLKMRPSNPRDGSTDLADMICKNENGEVRVKPPQISVPPVPDRYKALQVKQIKTHPWPYNFFWGGLVSEWKQKKLGLKKLIKIRGHEKAGMPQMASP